MKFKTIKMAVALGCFALAGVALACSEDGTEGILPENNYNIPVDHKRISGITEAQFNSIIDKVEAIYAPVISNLGARLVIQRNWTDGTVNAFASQQGKTWNVAMFGGLARHQTITPDGFALVACHEVGHHIGGAPKKAYKSITQRLEAESPTPRRSPRPSPSPTPSASWASNEGQADYFGTLKCLRRTFLNDDNISLVAAMNPPKALVDACTSAMKNDLEDVALCIRSGMAGQSLANLFAVLERLPEPKFDTPDSIQVSRTFDNHPKAQCRLDTYYQGSLCDVSMNEDVSQKEEVKGTCHSSLGHKVGIRPLCWFKPSK